ncbi:MAG: chorismate lyase [Gammaproteobacteria bacterium]|jgi:chorismate-pyruvate lyase|nr:chorismate lyase [Gammaproteobacteria bacterium]
MAEHTSDMLLRAQWLSAPAALAPAPHSLLLSWLTEPGLLTRRLKAACPNRFRLEVLPGDASLLREVALCCGDQRCIYAATEAPVATLAAHPWLQSLGAASLGETLNQRAAEHGVTVVRSAFSFAHFGPTGLPAGLLAPAAEAWARRSQFLLDGAALTVTEVFLPALLDHEQGRLRAAG